MASALLSSVLQSLDSILNSDLGLLSSTREELVQLSTAFAAIQALVLNAERVWHPTGEDEALTDWLGKLKDVAYDVDDLIQEWREKSLRFKENCNATVPALRSQVSKFLLHCLPYDEVDQVQFNLKLGLEMGRRLKKIRINLDVVCKEKANFQKKERRITNCLVNESEIIGRDSEKEIIINNMIAQSSTGEEPGVILIVGSVGIGKTTLAQLVFNDESVKDHFNLMIWVDVLDSFDAKNICVAIIEAVEQRCFPNNFYLKMVQNYLGNIVEKKRFLLVLDALWIEDGDIWDNVMLPLQMGGMGSCILVTTGNESVDNTMGTIYIHHVRPLLEADCLELLKGLALEGKNSEECLELADDCAKIAKECEGIPLVVKTTANVLRFRERREWELFLERKNIWNSIENFELLAMYINMSPLLKQCFLFCFIYPMDHVIERETIIRLWMAQGFLHESEEMETLGKRCLTDLLKGLYIEEDNNGLYKVHGTIYNFFNCRMNECCKFLCEASGIIQDCTRHISFHYREDATLMPPMISQKPQKFRTILVSHCSRIVEVPSGFYENLEYLRALDLSGTKIRKISDSIKKLILLRYLNLSTTLIEELPESITTLHLLQTLNLNHCPYLHTLPTNLKKLTRLRHLQIEGTESMDFLPDGLGKITSLRTLSRFIVGRNRGCKISELQKLDLLQGALRLERLEEVDNREEACEANLQGKHYLKGLHFNWSINTMRKVSGVVTVESVLENLQPPHLSLQNLTIENFGGFKMPTWIEGQLFSNLVRVALVGCFACRRLPALGKLPSLNYLYISGFLELEKVGHEFFRNDVGGSEEGSFPQLAQLVFKDMPLWKEWEWDMKEGDSPSLQILEIVHCDALRCLPNALVYLAGLQELRITSCENLLDYEEGGEGWQQIAHIPNVWINGQNAKNIAQEAFTIDEGR